MKFSIFISTLLVFGSFYLSYILTATLGDFGWAGRIGGTLVGFSVFLQGFIFANPERFTRILKSGLTLEQRLMHIIYTATVFGTFLWAYGDLLPKT